jgi:HEAT repeat protein
MDILKKTKSNPIRSNVITSLGEIKAISTEEILYDQMKVENEMIQMSTIKAIGQVPSFGSTNFLIHSVLAGRYRISNLSVRSTLYTALYQNIGKSLVYFLIPTLRSDDIRILSHTIDAFSLIPDDRIIELITPYLSHKSERVRGSAIIVLYNYRKCREECLSLIKQMFTSENDAAVDTAIYVIGRLQLKKYESQLLVFPHNNQETRMIKLAFALSSLQNKRGYDIFYEIFDHHSPLLYERTLLHFAQLPDNIRLRIMENFINRGRDPIDLVNILNQSPLNFLEEIRLLQELWFASVNDPKK